ncbi:MAG: hypothetical protein WC761_01765 [Candidatus Paceibacterota bacterium]|jgi:hypothetical protein
MSKKNKQKPRKPVKEQVGGPNFYGNPSFGGTGNFGRGGYKQLAHFGLNPATDKIAKQEQSEINANVDRETYSLGKYGSGVDPEPTPHWNGRNGTVNEEAEEASLEEQAPYDNSVSRMRDLPGFPKMNSLVNPKGFVPANDTSKHTDPSTGNKAEYLGPTLNGQTIDPDYESPDYSQEIDDDTSPAWDRTSGEEELEKLVGDEHMPEEEGREEDSSDLILHNYIEETLFELLGAPKATYPSRQGWNNKQINALVWRKNHYNSDNEPPDLWHRTFGDPQGDHNPIMTHGINQANSSRKTPAWSFGAIGYPKQHVPEDYEQENPDYDQIIQDPIGSRRLQSPAKEDSMFESLEETAIDVYSSSNNGENNMTGDLDADGSGPDGGAKAFQDSRKAVLKELISQIVKEVVQEQGTVAPRRRGPAAPQAPQQQVDLTGLRQILAKGQQVSKEEISQVIDYVSGASTLGKDFIAMSEPEIQALEQILQTNVGEERLGPFYNKVETARGEKHLQAQAQQQQQAKPQVQQPTKKAQQTGGGPAQKFALPKQGLSQQFQSNVKQKFDQISNAPGLNKQQKEKLVAQLGRIQLAPEGSEDSKLRQINDLIKSNLGTQRVDMPTPQATKSIGAAQIPQKPAGILGKAKSMFGLSELSLKEALREDTEDNG